MMESASQTFAEVLAGKSKFLDPSFAIDYRTFSVPVYDKTLAEIAIMESFYQEQLEKCHNMLPGRLSYLPKSNRYSIPYLNQKLSIQWNLNRGWDLTFLRKWYFSLRFDIEEDRRRVWATGF